MPIAMQGMLQGLRTLHATNYNMSEGNRTACAAAHNETYEFYPDDVPLHSLALKGDSRAALVPFMAHRCAPSSLLLPGCKIHNRGCAAASLPEAPAKSVNVPVVPLVVE